MDFSQFASKISKVQQMSLPGEAAQLEMAPLERLQELKRKAVEAQTARRAGVMVLFYPDLKLQTRFALILRKTYKGVHSAQIGFPGGSYEDSDTDLMQTALRETEEEIGVPTADIHVLKELTHVYIPPSNFYVHPYLGIAQDTPNFILQESEVDALVEVDLPQFLSDDPLTTRVLTTSYAHQIKVPAFELNGHIVWGATAMVLNEVRELLKQL